MKNSFLSSFSFLRHHITRHWAFVLFTLCVPVTLNIFAISMSEIKDQTVSYYYQTFKYLGVKPVIYWPAFIAELLVGLILIALIGFGAKLLLNKLQASVNQRELKFCLSTIIIGLTAFAYSLGTQFIDIAWSITFYTGPGFGLPRSSFYRINSIISFLLITIVFVVYLCFLNFIDINDEQPNPRSTRPW